MQRAVGDRHEELRHCGRGGELLRVGLGWVERTDAATGGTAQGWNCWCRRNRQDSRTGGAANWSRSLGCSAVESYSTLQSRCPGLFFYPGVVASTSVRFLAAFMPAAPCRSASRCRPVRTTAPRILPWPTNGTPAGSGKSGYKFVSTPSTGAGSAVPNQFLVTGTQISATTGCKAYCATDDGAIRTRLSGVITVVTVYATCQGLNPWRTICESRLIPPGPPQVNESPVRFP